MRSIKLCYKQLAYQYIGITQKVKGLYGELSIGLKHVALVLPSLSRIFVYIQGTYVPYLVESLQVQGKYAVVRLVGITTRKQAISLRGYRVFMDEKDIVSHKVQGYASMVGCLIEDVNQGLLGYVTHVYERFMQPCLCVAYQDDELLIPLHDAFVQEVHAKKIIVQLPKDYISTLLKR